MSNNPNIHQQGATKVNGATGLNAIDLFRYLLSKWYWYVAVILFFVAASWYWVARRPLIYSSGAQVMIKDPRADMNVDLEVGSRRGNNSLNNEVYIFRSKMLMAEAVKRAGADVNYQVKRNLRYIELYNNTPLRLVTVDSLSSQSFVLEMTYLGDNQVEIEGFPEPKKCLTLPLGKTTQTPYGPLTVLATDTFEESKTKGTTIKVTKWPVMAVASRYVGALTTDPQKMTRILELQIKDNHPYRAEQVLKALVEVYNEEAIDDKNESARKTAQFIDDRIVAMSEELGSVEQKLAEAQSEAIDVTALEVGSVNAVEISQVERELSLLRSVRAAIANPQSQQSLLPGEDIVEPTIGRQIAQYNEMKIRRDQIGQEGSSNNPVVKELDQTLGLLKGNITTAIDNLISSKNFSLRQMKNAKGVAINNMKSQPYRDLGTLDIARQQSIKADLYVFLLKKREENSLNQATAETNAKVIDFYTGYQPISPNRTKSIAIAILAALVLTTFVFVTQLVSDNKVRSKKELEEALSIPLLGVTPADPLQQKHTIHGIAAQGDDASTEAFRILRTSLLFRLRNIQGAEGGRTVMLTSLFEGAGKSYVSYNLARSLAFLGKRVALVDLDLRKASLSRRLQLAGAGVSDYILDPTSELAPMMVQPDAELPNLQFLSTGGEVYNPVELLMDERFDQLITTLRAEYDFVLFDSVPFVAVADAAVVSRGMDMSLFVIRSGVTDRRVLPDIQRIYDESLLPNMHLILNGAEFRKRGYG